MTEAAFSLVDRRRTIDAFISGNRRASKSDLESKQILRYSMVSPNLAGVSSLLEKELIKNKLKGLLNTRPPAAHLEAKHILRHSMVSISLAGVSSILEKELLRNKVKDLLRNKPDITDLENRNIIYSQGNKLGGWSRRLSAVLVSVAKELDFKLKEDQVKKLLENRPSREILAEKEIFAPSKVSRRTSAVLHGTALQLDAQFKKDKLNHWLKRRPSKDILERYEVLHTFATDLAASLQGPATIIDDHLKYRNSVILNKFES